PLAGIGVGAGEGGQDAGRADAGRAPVIDCRHRPDPRRPEEKMATISSIPSLIKNGYPTSDGKPMAETDKHRELMGALIAILKAFFQAHPRVYVSGNLLIFYEPDNKRRHVSPDVFVVKGVPKGDRLNYLVWKEG